MPPFCLPGSSWIDTDCDLLPLILCALDAKGRLPCPRPQTSLPAHFCRDNMVGLYLEENGSGWTANIGFRDILSGQPNTVGTPDALPLPYNLAFLGGAAIVCEIATGSRGLPFHIVGDQLLCNVY